MPRGDIIAQIKGMNKMAENYSAEALKGLSMLMSAGPDNADDIAETIDFLTYSGIDARNMYDQEEDMYCIYVKDAQVSKATRLIDAFLEEKYREAEPEDSETDSAEDIADTSAYEYSYVDYNDEEEDSEGSTGAFVASEVKYKDNSSSAYAFFIVALFVIVMLVCSSAGVIPLSITISTQPVMFVALILLAILFVAIGIYSLLKAEAYKQAMVQEKELDRTALDWFAATYTADQLDRSINAQYPDSTSEEELCLRRMELIKDYLLREYSDLEENHAEALSENIYTEMYEKG